MMKFLVALLAMSVVATVAAGCISSRAGTPQAAPGLSSGPVVPPSSTVSRPRQLDLTGVEVCTLLTNQQLANFAVDRPSRPGTAGGGSVLVGSPECQFGSDAEQHGFLILASTSMGLPEFLSKIQPNPSRAVITVNGYPAVQEEGLGELSAPERGSGACFVEVDVADGQLLGVQFSQIAAREPKRLPIETLCAKAREVAEAALTTLQGG